MSRDPALTRLGSPIESGTQWPRPACATCREGHLRFGEPKEIENAQSARMRHEEYWEPEFIFGTFRVDAHCENSDCRQIVVAVGTYAIEYASDLSIDDDHQSPYSTYYRVEYLTPSLPLIRVPDGTPQEVQEGVLRASRLLFADPGSAATALRATVERYLTSEGIPGVDGSRFLNLATRIEKWKIAAPGRDKVSELLTAIRWIGNAGTHEISDLTVKDVLEGIEFLDEAFHALFVGPDIDARAQAINVAKGPSRTP